MDVNTIFNTIIELGHSNNERVELREFCELHIEQIIQSLPRRILNSDGSDLLDCMLKGLPSNSSSALKSKIKVISIVLETMRKMSVSLTHCGDVVSRLCLELPSMPSDDLVKWIDDCVKSIEDDSDVNMIWRDVLPECLSALSSKPSFKYNDNEITVDEYREQLVNKLCQSRWKERQLVQLTAMFKDMQLSAKEHKEVVKKICSYMIDILPDSLPPLVHQLLRLCKTYNMEIALSYLSHYFSARLYSKLDPPPQDSESTTMDIDDIVQYSAVELSSCLSTCIYHISQGAADPELIKKHIKTWPKTQLLRAPLLIDIALTMSDKGVDFRSVCLDVIKSAVEMRVLDEKRRNDSAWVRSVLPPDVDVAGVFKVLTTESANHRQLTVEGLINLAFSLLAVSRLKPAARACWSHGKLILVRLSKSQPETAGHILSKLTDNLATDCTQRQYSECLYVLCKLTPVSVERCTQLRTILENCQPLPTDYQSAADVYDAVNPLINFSTRTRDVMIMVCRKGLHSRDTMHRCLALSGFLTVLRHLKLSSGSLSNSQSTCSDQYSGQSYLTQLTVDLHTTQQGAAVTSRIRNEAVCMEIVSILRRCLVQDATVRQLLYSSLYDCAKEKLALQESILELLYEHLSKYLSENGDNNTLFLDKCLKVSDASVVLMEPISYLLYVIVQFLQSPEDEDLEDILTSQSAETSSAHLTSKLKSIMDQLSSSENFGQNDLDGLGLTDLTPESKAKAFKVQQILQCYEALIAYQIMLMNNSNVTRVDMVLKLFNACNKLLEQTKVPLKSKKGNKLSLSDTRETMKTQKSQKSQEKGKGPTKLSNLVKDRAGSFKPLPCLWDIKFCLRVMQLLYSERVSWCSSEQRNKVRGCRPLHRWAAQGVLAALANDRIHKNTVKHVPAIAALLYNRCLCRFKEMCDFDDQTMLDCLEVFKQCLTLLLSPKYSLKVENFLIKITGFEDSSLHIESIAAILEAVYTALIHIESESIAEGTDVIGKKMVVALTQIATILLEMPAHSCPKLSAVIVKFEEHIHSCKEDCLSLIPPLLTAGYREQQESQLMDDLLKKLDSALGRIDKGDSSANNATTDFPTIDTRTGHNVLIYLCTHINDRFKCIEHLLSRSRDLTKAMNIATPTNQHRIDRELSELYDSVMLQLCQCCAWASRGARLRCAVGVASGRVLGVCLRLYALLATLVKNMDIRAAYTQRFERLLKLSGKKFSSICDHLISYLEASQQQKNASKVLRDTKLIPRLVLETEQFSKNVILLANKTKMNFQQYFSLGTARDFKIRDPILQEVLKAREHTDENRENDSSEDLNDAATEVLSLVGNDDDQLNEDSE